MSVGLDAPAERVEHGVDGLWPKELAVCSRYGALRGTTLSRWLLDAGLATVDEHGALSPTQLAVEVTEGWR